MMLEDEIMTGRTDIRSDDDIRQIVDRFYGSIGEDPLLAPYFAPLDMPAHLPKMYEFWSSVVFQTGTYRGRPFDAHVRLEDLSPSHFSAWLDRFEATVDDLFEGERADLMKEKARQIAAIFQIKLGLDPDLSSF